MNEEQQPISEKQQSRRTTINTTKTSLEVLPSKYHRWEILLSQRPIVRDIEKPWFHGVWMPLTMRQISNQNLNDGCVQLDTPIITITSDVLGVLENEGP